MDLKMMWIGQAGFIIKTKEGSLLWIHTAVFRRTGRADCMIGYPRRNGS